MTGLFARTLLVSALFALGCGDAESAQEAGPSSDGASAIGGDATTEAVARSIGAARAGADSVIDALRPVPLMTPAQEEALRRYGNAQHLTRARALGVRPASESERDAFVAAGRLVEPADSSPYYVIEDRDALLVPGAIALLEEVGRRFQAELARRGLPPYRVVVSSTLRSAEGQAALRRSNPNAAAGTSTHEFGTTMDILYEAYAAPLELPAEYVPDEPASLRPHLDVAARALLEQAAARKSREMMAILGGVLRAMQAEGAVYVTLERQQPVYHITLAR